MVVEELEVGGLHAGLGANQLNAPREGSSE